MARNTSGFDPGQEPFSFDDPELDNVSPRFNPSQHRAFGSVPNLLGKELTIAPFEHIPEQAWMRTDSAVLRLGLFSEKGAYQVNGLVLSPEYHEAIIRNQKSFLASTGSKTVSANRLNNSQRQQEKYDKSQTEPLVSKHARHRVIIEDLKSQQANLSQLLEWQRTPGYWRTDETDLRVRTTQAWQQTFVGMLSNVKDNYGLSVEEKLDMEQAMAYRLFRGKQADRVAEWGGFLRLGADYTRSVRLLFEQSDRKIGRALAERTVH